MAIGLDDALLGWLVGSAGDAVVRRLRGDPARRVMRQVVEQAVEATVAQVAGHIDGRKAKHLRSLLLIRDGTPGVRGVTVTSEAELRRALHIWTAALDHPEFSGYFSELGVDAQLLADTLTDHIAAGIQRNGRSGGALDGRAAWLWRDGLTDHLARIEKKLDATAATTEPVGGGLPGGTPDFTGRQEALVELAERVQAHDPAGTVVAIHAMDGMAGVGKTELAVRAAHQHKHRYPDGQYFLNLHGYTDGIPEMPPEVALEELLRQAGVPGAAIPSDLAGRQARWQALMATRRALVLLDNALDEDQVHPLLPNAAGCLVLITSRTQLRGLPGAKALPLDVPPPAEAVELFTRLVNVGRQLDLDAVARIVDMVGRLPVAVRAVAAQVDKGYTEAELADDLAQAKARLGLVDPASPLGAGVRTAFETSIRRLDHAHQRVFWILGVHPGPSIGVPQFAALAALPIASARAMLRELAKRNLIMTSHSRVGHRRFHLHDLMRAFAREQAASHLSKEDQAAAITRLTGWYAAAMSAVAHLRGATGSEPGESGAEGLHLDQPATAYRWIAAEQGNLLAYAETAIGPSAAKVCRQAARNLYDLCYHTTARALYHTAAALYQQAGDRGGEADAQHGLGHIARCTSDHHGAADHYSAAQSISNEIGDRRGEADARLGLGHVALFLGNYPGAAEHYLAAQNTFKETDDRGGEAHARVGLGEVARLTGDYPGAAEHYLAAVNTYQEIGDRGGGAHAWIGLGEVARLIGCYPGAAGYFRAAQNISQEIGDRGAEAHARVGRGNVALAIDNHPAAAEHHRAARSTYKEIGDRGGVADARLGLGHVARLSGDYPAAAEHYRAAHSTYKEIGDRDGRAYARLGEGEVAMAIGDYPGAAAHFRAAQSIFKQIGDRAGEADALWSLGDVANGQGRHDEAREHWESALRIYEDIGSPSAAVVRDMPAQPDARTDTTSSRTQAPT